MQAETRAEFSERSVAKLEKTIDDLEGMTFIHSFSHFSVISAPGEFSFIRVIVKHSGRKPLSLQVIKLSAFYFCHHAVPQTFCPTGFLSASVSVQSHN